MKNKIKKIFYNLNYKIFMKNIFLLESNPDFMDNTKALFDEMIKTKFNFKYKIIWIVKTKQNFKNIKIKNVKFISYNGNVIDKIRFHFYLYFSKYIIDCNNYIYKRNKNQFRMHLTHGAIIKRPIEYFSQVGDIDYILQLSDFFSTENEKLYKVNKEKLITLGFPRNDYLFHKYDNIKKLFQLNTYKKIILWMPTYRNHTTVNNIYNTGIKFKYGIPTISTSEEINELNTLLKKNNELLLIKFHPAEDITEIKKLVLSNIKVMDEEKLIKNNLNIYQFLTCTDALITDYSSIYYDYLLTDKPIALAIPDIKEYTKKISIIFDNYEDNIIGDYIYNFADLKKFLNNVSENIDLLLIDRKNIKKKYNKYVDCNSSKRVLDFIKYKIKQHEKEEDNYEE